MAPMPPRFTDAERDQLRQLHAAGKSCNAIARELGRSPSTISRVARELDLPWASTRTETAVAAHVASSRERRAKLVERLYTRADRIMDRLDAPTFKLVGMDKDGNARTNVVDADAIPGAEERALFGMVMNALNTAAKMEAVDSGHTSADEGRGIIGALDDALQHAYGQLAHAGGTPTAREVEAELDDGA